MYSSEILTAAGIMGSVASVLGGVLAVAYRYLRVEEDPRIEIIEEGLPGSNCGACGQPGCHAFAERVVAGDEPPSKCTVSSPNAIDAIARFLGVDAGAQQKRVARLHCAGGRSSVRTLADYRGPATCRASFQVNGGGRACPWGCLGFGDCKVACTFDAIVMSDEALPVVHLEGCTACGDCVDVCPVDIFAIEPLSQPLIVQCSSPLTGDLARNACDVACDACGRCAADVATGVIDMVNGLPIIRDLTRTAEAATYRCPTGAIQWVTGKQFEVI